MHVAGVLLKYIDASTGVILHNNSKIDHGLHIHLSDIRLNLPVPHKQKADKRNSLIKKLRNKPAHMQENLLHMHQQ